MTEQTWQLNIRQLLGNSSCHHSSPSASGNNIEVVEKPATNLWLSWWKYLPFAVISGAYTNANASLSRRCKLEIYLFEDKGPSETCWMCCLPMQANSPVMACTSAPAKMSDSELTTGRHKVWTRILRSPAREDASFQPESTGIFYF